MVERANVAALSELGTIPWDGGGAWRWKRGSAVPQKSMPVAIVVHKVMENHRHLLNIGWASAPPILYLPIGEKYVVTTRSKKNNALTENIQPKRTNIHVLMATVEARKVSVSNKLKMLTITISKKIGQNTLWRMFLRICLKSNGGSSGEY